MKTKDTTSHLSSGREAETLAVNFLLRQGLKILTRNYRCRGGEIDVIAKDGNTLVFVEVRLRRNAHFGNAAESITPAKQQKIIHAAQHYLSQMRVLPNCRFDCIVLSALNEQHMEWIRAAFTTD